MSTALLGAGPHAAPGPGPAARPGRLQAFCDSPWAVVLVFALAVFLRGTRLTEWSMWEDEEGTVFFSQHTHLDFPRAFPMYFVALKAVYALTGVSVTAGRVFSAAVALVGLGLFYFCFRGFVGRRAALLSLLFLAINCGHLFWSQSIRYYNLVLLFQVVSMYCFFVGFERRSYAALLLANGAFALAMLTHFSAILLAPALVGYLMVAAWRREGGGAYNVWGYLVFGVPLAIILALFAARLVQMQEMLGGLTIASARDPVHVLVTVAAYFGLPLVALGLLSPVLAPSAVPRRVLMFFMAVSFIPVLELLVIAKLNLINATWYYALFALLGFAVLASLSLIGLAARGYGRLALLGGALTVAYSAALLGGYYTSMYGDRPRWEEAARYLGTEAGIRPGRNDNPLVYSTVPGVVHYYLLGPRENDIDLSDVLMLPDVPPEGPVPETWYVIEVGHVSPEYEQWLAHNCTERARFESRTGPRDRTVVIYHHTGT
jgi:hypothetical protein